MLKSGEHDRIEYGLSSEPTRASSIQELEGMEDNHGDGPVQGLGLRKGVPHFCNRAGADLQVADSVGWVDEMADRDLDDALVFDWLV